MRVNLLEFQCSAALCSKWAALHLRDAEEGNTHLEDLSSLPKLHNLLCVNTARCQGSPSPIVRLDGGAQTNKIQRLALPLVDQIVRPRDSYIRGQLSGLRSYFHPLQSQRPAKPFKSLCSRQVQYWSLQIVQDALCSASSSPLVAHHRHCSHCCGSGPAVLSWIGRCWFADVVSS